MDIFGESLGLKKASISNMVKAVKCVATVDSLDMTAWTMGQITELMRLETEQINELLDNGTIDCTMSTKEIRDAVKALKAPTDNKGKTDGETDDEGDGETTTTTTATESKTEVITITVNDHGELTTMEVNDEVRDKVLAILLAYGVAKRINDR